MNERFLAIQARVNQIEHHTTSPEAVKLLGTLRMQLLELEREVKNALAPITQPEPRVIKVDMTASEMAMRWAGEFEEFILHAADPAPRIIPLAETIAAAKELVDCGTLQYVIPASGLASKEEGLTIVAPAGTDGVVIKDDGLRAAKFTDEELARIPKDVEPLSPNRIEGFDRIVPGGDKSE